MLDIFGEKYGNHKVYKMEGNILLEYEKRKKKRRGKKIDKGGNGKRKMHYTKDWNKK